MQARRFWFLPAIVSALYAAAAAAVPLIPMEEPAVELSSPSQSISPLQYALVNSFYVGEPITATPLLCGNTSAPASPYMAISPIYYSSQGRTSLKPFVLGASAADPNTSALAFGANLNYGSTMRLTGDPSLVCYGLDASGVHGPTPGVFRDGHDGANYSPTLRQQFNSSVVLTVFHVPTSASDFYGYTIDVTIPATPANVTCGAVDCNFALLEGFDSSVFATNSGQTHPDEGWCIGSAGSTSCVTSTVEGGINLNYSTWANTILPHLTTGGSQVSYRFVVKRYFASGVSSLPASGDPVAIAALFSPFDLDENYVADNVSVGYANSPPSVVSDATWTTFSNSLAGLSEGTNSGALAFNVTDFDTVGPLTAAVTLNLAGLSIPLSPSCNATSGSGASNSQCSFSVNLSNSAWWNASVGAQYEGLGNVFATDPGGVSATASIVVTDALGKSSKAVNVPIHVQSKVNSPPLVTFSGSFPSVADSRQGGTSYPTWSCSIGAGNCGGTFNVVSLPHSISGQPGPAAAFDELVTQTVDVNSVACGQSGEQDAIFQNSPVIALSSGSSSDFDVTFQLKNPLVTGSSLCSVVITDKMASYPPGEAAATTSKLFRVVVNQ